MIELSSETKEIVILPQESLTLELLPYQTNIELISQGSSSTLPIAPPVTASFYDLIVLNNGISELADSRFLPHSALPIGLLQPDNTVIYSGLVQNSNWNFNPNLPIFVGVNGQLVQIPLATLFTRVVALPLTTNQILILQSEAILL